MVVIHFSVAFLLAFMFAGVGRFGLGVMALTRSFVASGVKLLDWWKNVLIRFDFVIVFSDALDIISHLILISFGVIGLLELFTIIPVV